ncbi:hypothetical protein [Listeria sp. ILCC792]|uniref:hypothetical protein n=1 Tax=Listeria sp. ILCC792 TaxID=1918331 RepID=UPI000B58E815|nr:hypothetical protein [Listeria sp. ILCC792]
MDKFSDVELEMMVEELKKVVPFQLDLVEEYSKVVEKYYKIFKEYPEIKKEDIPQLSVLAAFKQMGIE